MSTERTLEERVATLETNVATIKEHLENSFDEIKRDIRELRDKYAARPSWAVCTIIAGLGSLATALGATLLTLLVQTGG